MRVANFSRVVVGILSAVLLITAAITYATPIKDGDFFWHSAYGRYMVENKTLIPDHAIFSWTSADGSTIKNNWIPDILLYLMLRFGGLPLVFAFKYACFLFIAILIILFVRICGQEISPFHLLIICIVLLSTPIASFIKPEIFSLVYFSILFFLYFILKSSAVDYRNKKYYILFPILFAMWVNSHEVVLFGLATFFLILVGEFMNYLFRTIAASNPRFVKYLGIAVLASACTFFLNPYGFRYPLNLITFIIAPGADDLSTILSYQSIFYSGFSKFHFFEFWLSMVVIFVLLTSYLWYKKKEADLALILPNLFLGTLFLLYIRTTFYWPVFWVLTTVYQLSRIDKTFLPLSEKLKPILTTAICLLIVLFSFRAVDDAVRSPKMGQWFGFGGGYSNPVQEADFILQHKPEGRIYNSYITGGYLIWRLYPDYKVFMDSRYFPYKYWYQDYMKFFTGKQSLADFSAEHRFDVALIDYLTSEDTLSKFLTTDDWKLGFYGTTGAVFVRKGAGFHADAERHDIARFNDLHTIHQAFWVFKLAQNIGDFKVSQSIIDMMKEKFAYMEGYGDIIYKCALSWNGLQAMSVKDYDSAFRYLDVLGVQPYMLKTNEALLFLRNRKVKHYVEGGELMKAFELLEKNISSVPDHVHSLYNAGMIGYIMIQKHKTQLSNMASRAKQYLELVISLKPNDKFSMVARNVISGNIMPTVEMLAP